MAETVLMRINALVTENEVLTQGHIEKGDSHKPRSEAWRNQWMNVLISSYSFQTYEKQVHVVETTQSTEICCENPVKEKHPTGACGHKP